MSGNPARILKLEGRGCLKTGTTADVTIIDPEAKYRIDASAFCSRGRNTPFDVREVYGKVRYTIAAGKIVYENTK